MAIDIQVQYLGGLTNESHSLTPPNFHSYGVSEKTHKEDWFIRPTHIESVAEVSLIEVPLNVHGNLSIIEIESQPWKILHYGWLLLGYNLSNPEVTPFFNSLT